MSQNQHIDLKISRKIKPYHWAISNYLGASVEDADIVDVGCGRGELISLILENSPNANISALDYDPRCLELSRAAGAGNTYQFDINKPRTYPKIKVDVVILSHVLEHTHNPMQVLRSLSDLVNPGGRLIVAVPNPTRPAVFFGNFVKSHYVNKGHCYAWDPSHWKNFLEEIMGLNVETYFSDQVLWFKGPVGRLLARLTGYWFAKKFPWLGGSNIAVIRL
jgi:2-polyprenyl-3-methyl-5-hydroxy-6-metoxy-1,4-benzoquinol methylase